jgi:MFS family permease
MTVAVCSPALGYLLDRVSPRRILVPCMVVFGCAFASLALLTANIWHLYATFFLMGVVGNGTAQMAYSRAVSSWFVERRGMALAVVMSGGAIGAMVLPPAAEALIEGVGWRVACVILGIMVLAIGVPAVAFIRERPADRQGLPDGNSTASGTTVREAVNSRVFWIVVTVLFFTSIAQNGALTHLAAMLTDRGVSPAKAATALAAMGGASLWPVPHRLLLDRSPPRGPVRCSPLPRPEPWCCRALTRSPRAHSRRF